MKPSFLFRLAAVVLIAVFAGFITGCATTDESTIPWNTPQSWEGAPALPGLNQE
jgi:hypothetical protein